MESHTKLAGRTKAQNFFDMVLEDVKDCTIEHVFCEANFGIDARRPYYTDYTLYILFCNKKCMVVDYYFVGELHAEYRTLSREELSYCIDEDLFNNSYDIYGQHGLYNQEISLKYAPLEKVELHPLYYEYNAWENGDLIVKPARNDMFHAITFHMGNGKSFSVCPMDAVEDGYTEIWSEDAIMKIDGEIVEWDNCKGSFLINEDRGDRPCI